MTEFHNRLIGGQWLSWDVSRLRSAATGLPVEGVPLGTIFEFDKVYWFDEEHRPTCRAILEHLQRIEQADLSDPIILSSDGFVVDGMHRVAKAHLLSLTSISAVRLAEYPAPDGAVAAEE